MAKKRKQKLFKISSAHKEALAQLASRPEFKTFLQFLKTQQNNIAVITWFRTPAEDPDLALKKKYYEGQFDMLKFIMKAFREVTKVKEE